MGEGTNQDRADRSCDGNRSGNAGGAGLSDAVYGAQCASAEGRQPRERYEGFTQHKNLIFS